MSNTLALQTHDIIPPSSNEYESSVATEFSRRVLSEPGLRHQLTGLMQQVHIDRVALLDLGYSRFPFVRISAVLRHMNLDHLSREEQRRAIADSLLKGCMEARDNLDASDSASEIDTSGDALARLPFELQLVAIAKAYSGDSGCSFSPMELGAGTDRLQLLLDYAQQKLGMSPVEAELMRQAVTVINGSAIVKEHISFALWNQPVEDGAFPRGIVGRPAPNEGYYLPDMMEDAIRQTYYTDAWQAGYADKAGKVADDSLKIGEVITKLCDFEPDATSFWGGYGMTSLLVEEAFIERSEGYSGSVGQLVSWKETIADEKFYEQYVYIRKSLGNLSQQ